MTELSSPRTIASRWPSHWPSRKAALAALAFCVGAAGWAGVARWQAPSGAGSQAQSPQQLLDAIALPSAGSESDRALLRALARARQSGDAAASWVELGDALMQKQRDSADSAYAGHAENAYRRALALDAGNDAAMTGLAWVNGGRHQFETSVEWAAKAIALNPQNSRAFGVLGDAKLELGDYAAAFEHYQKMLDLRPDLSSYSRSAHLLHVTGQTFRAGWMMRKAIESGVPTAESTAWCRAQLALIYFSEGQLAAADSLLADAATITPDNRHVLAATGRVKAALNDPQAAMAAYQRAIAIAPEHDALVALGDLHALAGDTAQAEKLYAMVEELHRKNHAASDTTHNMPMALFYADHDRNIVEALRLAEARKTTQNVFELDVLAWSYFKNGQLELAQSAIRRALRMRTPEARFLYHAGMIEAALGNQVAAQRYLYGALSLNSGFSVLDAPIAARQLDALGQVPAVADASAGRASGVAARRASATAH